MLSQGIACERIGIRTTKHYNPPLVRLTLIINIKRGNLKIPELFCSPTMLTKFTSLLCFSALSLSAYAQSKAPDLAKGQAIASQVCAACHMADGNSTISVNPKLAGQHAAYLAKQLNNFKPASSGKAERENPVMLGFASSLSNEDVLNVSAWFASQKQKGGEAKNTATLALGQQIYRGGIKSKSVSACAGCHSPNGAGIPALYPRIGGQHAEYIEAQLLAFRDGKRNNSKEMSGVVARMNDAEIKAVSDYIAGLH